MRSRLFRTLAATMAATVVGALAVPASASATAPNPGFRTLPAYMRDGNTWVESVQPSSFQVGDCILTDSWVGLTRPDNNGRVTAVWYYSMYTLHTNNFDQWHATFRFRDAIGNLIFEFGPVHSGEMHHAGPSGGDSDEDDYPNLFFGVRSPNFRTFDQIATVEWQGEC